MNYWAVFISLIGVKTAARWMLEIEVRPMEWFVPNEAPNGELFCNALSLAIISEKLNIMDDDCLALLFLVAAGDLNTLVHLYREKMLPMGSFQRIVIEAVCRGQRDIVDWVLSLGDRESLGIYRKPVLDAAIEAGDLETIKLFYDSNLYSSHEAIYELFVTGNISEMEILDYFLGMDDADPIGIFQRLHLNFLRPDNLQGFERLGQDRHLTRESMLPYLHGQLLRTAAKLGSLSMVKRLAELGGFGQEVNGFQLLAFASRVIPPAFDLVEWLLQQHILQPFSDNTDSSAFTECLGMAVSNGNINIIKMLFGLEGFVLGEDRPVLEWAAEAGQNEVVQYLLTSKEFDQLQYNRALTAAVENNRPGVVRLLLDSGLLQEIEPTYLGKLTDDGDANSFQDLFIYACAKEMGAIVRLFVESGIIDPSYSDGKAFRTLCDVSPLIYRVNVLEDWDEESDRTDSETSSVFDSDEDGDGDRFDMELDDDGEMASEMRDGLFDSEGIRRWEFNEDDAFREYDRIRICQYLIESGKALRLGLTKNVLVAAASLPVSMFQQVMHQCCFSLDALDPTAISKALQNAIYGQQLATLRLILTTRPTYDANELLGALDVALIRGGKVYAYEILKHLSLGSVGYSEILKAFDENCDVSFISNLWSFLKSETRSLFSDLVAEKQRWDIVRALEQQARMGIL
ncbi:hypothetical protein HDU76_006866 [Blyttiomyces sp. JEL0837]|nr:hypothetical protein HDU76_006866 [Blyttiomyces sp. JEL0837]